MNQISYFIPRGNSSKSLCWHTNDFAVCFKCRRHRDAVYAACEAALAQNAADPRFSFLQYFWGLLPEATAEGAQCVVRIGPQLANRVGHVQGGILMGVAAETAKRAVPSHPVLSNISAWFTGPGRGGDLLARSWAVHTGRSLAVVRTEITGPDGARVLEATSAHAA